MNEYEILKNKIQIIELKKKMTSILNFFFSGNDLFYLNEWDMWFIFILDKSSDNSKIYLNKIKDNRDWVPYTESPSFWIF